MVYMEYPSVLLGVVVPTAPPVRVALPGALTDYACKPFRPNPQYPCQLMAIEAVGVGNLYEGPGPVRLFEI